MVVEKRVRFKSWWLPWALVAPQMAVVIVFFFWPAGQTVYWSMLVQDAFGANTEFVLFDNFVELLKDPLYPFHEHVIPRLALILFVLAMPSADDSLSVDEILERRKSTIAA